MRISYNKLWKMLIDKSMKKSDLKDKAGISSASLAKSCCMNARNEVIHDF